jgi:hypothetical protein
VLHSSLRCLLATGLMLLVSTSVLGQIASNGTSTKGPHPLPVTSRVSVDSNGGQANSFSLDPTLSADGRYVAFRSAARNLGLQEFVWVARRLAG